jgi:hypothetical protein
MTRVAAGEAVTTLPAYRVRSAALPWPLVIFVAALVVQFLRWPSLLLHPEFMGDDGPVFSRALTGGLETIVEPYAGYLIVGIRAIALAAASVPIAQSPMVAMLLTALVAAAVAGFVASRRLAWLGAGPLLGLAVVMVPGVVGIFGPMVHVQWFAGAYLAALAAATSPRTRFGLAVDLIAATLAGLTGPVGVFLVPLFMARWWFRRDRGSLWTLAVVGLTALVQAAIILASPSRGAIHQYGGLLDAILTKGVVGPVLGQAGVGLVLFVAAVPIVIALVWSAIRLGWISLALAYAWAVIPAVGLVTSDHSARAFTEQWVGDRYFFLSALVVVAIILAAGASGPPTRWPPCSCSGRSWTSASPPMSRPAGRSPASASEDRSRAPSRSSADPNGSSGGRAARSPRSGSGMTPRSSGDRRCPS